MDSSIALHTKARLIFTAIGWNRNTSISSILYELSFTSVLVVAQWLPPNVRGGSLSPPLATRWYSQRRPRRYGPALWGRGAAGAFIRARSRATCSRWSAGTRLSAACSSLERAVCRSSSAARLAAAPFSPRWALLLVCDFTSLGFIFFPKRPP